MLSLEDLFYYMTAEFEFTSILNLIKKLNIFFPQI